MRKRHWRTEVFRHGSSNNDFLMLTTLVLAMILATGFCVASHRLSFLTTVDNTTVAIADR